MEEERLLDRSAAALRTALSEGDLSEPADGPAEIGYLLSELRAQADLQRAQGYCTCAAALARAADLLQRQAAPVPADGPTFRDAIQLAQGCHDYSGGYGSTPWAEAFHAGIATVASVLTKASSGPWDHQTQAVFAAGKAHTLPLPASDLEVQPDA